MTGMTSTPRQPGFYWVSINDAEAEPARWRVVEGVGSWALLGRFEPEKDDVVEVVGTLSPDQPGRYVYIPELRLDDILREFKRKEDGPQ